MHDEAHAHVEREAAGPVAAWTLSSHVTRATHGGHSVTDEQARTAVDSPEHAALHQGSHGP
jgi:hypothetical protein